MLYLKCKGALEESSLRVIQRRMNYFSGNYFNHTKSHKELYSGEKSGWGAEKGRGTWTGRGLRVAGTTRRRKEQSNLGSQGDLGVRGWACPWGNGGTPKAGYQISDIKGPPGS